MSMLVNFPAGFEQSPFKLTPEFVEVMDGVDSELWNEFRFLLLKGMMAARKHMDRVINIVEIMRSSKSGHCICFSRWLHLLIGVFYFLVQVLSCHASRTVAREPCEICAVDSI